VIRKYTIVILAVFWLSCPPSSPLIHVSPQRTDTGVPPLSFCKRVMENCSICTDPMSRDTAFVLSGCAHEFHYPCIKQWFHYHSGTCPLCRAQTRDVRSVVTDLTNPDAVLRYVVPNDEQRRDHVINRAYHSMPTILQVVMSTTALRRRNGDQMTGPRRATQPSDEVMNFMCARDEALLDATPMQRQMLHDVSRGEPSGRTVPLEYEMRVKPGPRERAYGVWNRN